MKRRNYKLKSRRLKFYNGNDTSGKTMNTRLIRGPKYWGRGSSVVGDFTTDRKVPGSNPSTTKWPLEQGP